MFKFNYGFGDIIVQKFTETSFKVIESTDPCLTVGTIIPVEDLKKAGAIKIG
ncbi:hypothetical protein [Citrobacter phage Ci1]|nr:hypothetical protein [Citrobacter phage Ci1]